MGKVVVPLNSQKLELNPSGTSKIRHSLSLKTKTIVIVFLVLIIVAITFAIICLFVPWSKGYWMPDYESFSQLGRYKFAAVSTDTAPCAVIGKDILQRNGSVVDAAIAVLVCMGAYNPQSMGLGGGFLMLIYNRSNEKFEFLDAREVAPRAATKDMFAGNATVSWRGGLSIAVPGELAGYYAAHKNYGVLPWKELFSPTIRMCREGLIVNNYLATLLKKHEKIIKEFEAIRSVFVDNSTGSVYQENDIIKRPDLANTFEVISNIGIKAIYGPSEMATKFLQELKAAGSIIDKEDMLKYTPEFRRHIKMPLRDNITLHSVSPSGSGALLAFILGILDGYPDINPNVPQSKDSTVLTLHRMIEAFKYAYARRGELQDDDSEETKELLKNLTSKEHIADIRRRIDDARTHEDLSLYGIESYVTEDHGTAHLSIVAPNGDAVSVTSTINYYFGSMVMSPSTGIIMNNEMDDFSSPNITNYFGLPPSTKNYIRPKKRPMSSMCPTIFTDGNGDVRLVLGGNGGTKITTSVAQVSLRNLFLGDDIKRSIDGPRLHHQLFPNHIIYKENFPKDILEELRKKGHKTHLLNEMSMMGIIMAIARGSDGYLYANSDYRKQGGIDGF